MKTILVFAIWIASPARAADSVSPIELTVGKSVVIDSAVDLERVVVAAPDIAEAMAVSSHEGSA